MSATGFPESNSVEVPEIPVEETVSVPAADTALIVVDMQNDFVGSGGALPVEAAAETVDNIGHLITRAKAHGVPVVFTQDTHTEDDLEFDLWPRHCVKGTRGWEIIEDLPREEDDVVLRKNRYDAFYGTPLEHYLSHVWDIEQVIIVGTVANICVGQTAASAGLRWYDVVTPADGISAQTEFDQASALRQISFLYNGTIVRSSEDVEFSTGN